MLFKVLIKIMYIREPASVGVFLKLIKVKLYKQNLRKIVVGLSVRKEKVECMCHTQPLLRQ